MSYHLFQRFGVELEYMIVDRGTLAVRPIADHLLRRAAREPGATLEPGGNAEFPGDVAFADIAWSNELVLHVLEFKTTDPARSLTGLDAAFARNVARANELLAQDNAMLLPTGMHPTMDPDAEMRLWPHDNSPVYETFNRIFDCRGHGWANLQAAHLNLPFAGDASPDDEFGRLHAAIRVLLPILPAIAASTPIMDGRLTGTLDNRLEVYRTNSAKIPQATGSVIPERAFTRADYERDILRPIYDAYAPHDPEGVLRDEWANSRGAIARFSRATIEVRVLDVQECPAADLAVLSLICAVLRRLAAGEIAPIADVQRAETAPLARLLRACIQDADRAMIDDAAYLSFLGWRGAPRCTALELWSHLAEDFTRGDAAVAAYSSRLRTLLSKGPLARRLASTLAPNPSPHRVREVYARLAACLANNQMFVA